jgi:hypothetical protein
MSDAHRLTDPKAVLQFVFAGNSRFTLVSTATGKRFTFRVRTADDKPSFVSVLTGSCNEGDYSFIGTIFGKNAFRHGRKSQISERSPSVTAFKWFLGHLLAGNVPASMEFWHEGRCGRCARPLTDPVSIASGFGPECVKHNQPGQEALFV